MNSVYILFSLLKNLGRVIKRHSFHEEKLVLGETNSQLERIFNSHRYQVKNMLSIVSSIYIV